jgi:hypothetical protein
MSVAVVTKSANCTTAPSSKKSIVEPTRQSLVFPCIVDYLCTIAHTLPYTWYDVDPAPYCSGPLLMTFQLLDVRTYSTITESQMIGNQFNFTFIPTPALYNQGAIIPYRLDVLSYVGNYTYDWNKKIFFNVTLFKCDIVLPPPLVSLITCYQSEPCEIGPVTGFAYNNATLCGPSKGPEIVFTLINTTD